MPSSEFRTAYESYCKENGLDPESPQKVGARLRELGCKSKVDGRVRAWHGIRLKLDSEIGEEQRHDQF